MINKTWNMEPLTLHELREKELNKITSFTIKSRYREYNFSERLTDWYCEREPSPKPGTILEEIQNLEKALEEDQKEKITFCEGELEVEGIYSIETELNRMFGGYDDVASGLQIYPAGNNVYDLFDLGIIPLDPVMTLRHFISPTGGTKSFYHPGDVTHNLGTFWTGADDTTRFLYYQERGHLGRLVFGAAPSNESRLMEGVFGIKSYKMNSETLFSSNTERRR
ncbi:MAG: hypothetical protein ACQESG_05290 [Nanobdellota archaeon]